MKCGKKKVTELYWEMFPCIFVHEGNGEGRALAPQTHFLRHPASPSWWVLQPASGCRQLSLFPAVRNHRSKPCVLGVAVGVPGRLRGTGSCWCWANTARQKVPVPRGYSSKQEEQTMIEQTHVSLLNEVTQFRS